MKPASGVTLHKANNTCEKEKLSQYMTETTAENNCGNTLNVRVLDPEAMSAAELIARANIIMAQECGTPPEIAGKAKAAEFFCGKAVGFAEKIQAKADKISEFYKAGEKTTESGRPLREIFRGKDGFDVMFEYAPNGEILRQSTFENGILQSVEESRPDGTKNVLSLKDGKLAEYKEAFFETSEGFTMDRYFTFNDGEKSMYFENYGEFTDGSSKAGRWIWFEDGKMSAYYEGMKSEPDGSSVVDLHLRYDKEGTLFLYITDLETGVPCGKHFVLEDGEWVNKAE